MVSRVGDRGKVSFSDKTRERGICTGEEKAALKMRWHPVTGVRKS
jgi:hypothetical protein